MLESNKKDEQQYKLIIFDWEGTLAKADGCLFNGVKEAIALLVENNFKCAIATSMSLGRLNDLLDETEMQDYFTYLQTADSGTTKPDPEMLTEILDYTLDSAATALMVGDSVYDLSMATKANIDVIGVLTGADTGERLALAMPKAILTSVTDLPAYLKITI